MKISKKAWQKYISDLRKLSDAAADQFSEYLQTHDTSTQEGIQAAIDYAYALATKYGEGTSEMACQMYDKVASVSGKNLPPAEPARTASYNEVEKAVRGIMKQSRNPDYIGSAVGRQVKMVGLDTMRNNALRDGAQFAWIPSGDTCPFCLMLASNGWQYASKKAIKNGHAEHVHANCDCTYAVRFSDGIDVEGYDPDALREQYLNAGDNQTERINALRRAHYEQNKDFINQQKRLAYAKHKHVLNTKLYGNNESAAFLSVRVGNSVSHSEEKQMKKVLETATKRYPDKVIKELDEYTIVLGSERNSCDKINKIIYLGKDIDIYTVDHEVGHVIETMVDQDKLHAIKLNVLNGKTIFDYDVAPRVDSAGNRHVILTLNHEDLITEYQGRIYSEGVDDVFEIMDNHDIIADRMWELVSETYPYYMAGNSAPNKTIQSIYDLIEEVI